MSLIKKRKRAVARRRAVHCYSAPAFAAREDIAAAYCQVPSPAGLLVWLNPRLLV